MLFIGCAAFAHPPVSVVMDSRGNAYYSDLERVWRVAPDGTKSVAVPGVHTHELFVDAHDNLYGEHLWYEGERTNKWGHYVWKRAPDGRVSMVIPRTEGFLTNYSFVRDAAGNMYWADRERKAIVMRTPAGRNVDIARAAFRDIRWMSAMPDGTLSFVDDGDLLRVTHDRKLVRLARNLARGRHALQGLWHDRAGNVYVARSSKGEVIRVTAAGAVTVVAESPLGWRPCGGMIAPNGELLLLEYSVINAVRLRRVPR